MKKTYKCILSIIVLIILEIILATNKVEATSTATLSGDKTVNKGDTVTVTAQVTAGAWNLTLSGAGKTEGLVGQTSVTSNASASKSLTFTASEVGTYKITLKGDITDYDTDETISIDKTATITVKEVETTPTPTPTPTPAPDPEPEKATLSTFKINGITVKQYLTLTNKENASIYVKTSNGENATVYNSLTKKSYTVKSDSTVNIQILEGTNTLTITLASGNSYTRKIYSQKEEETQPNVIEETPEEVKVILKSLSIKGVKSEEEKVDFTLTPEFSSEVYEYSLTIPEEQYDITKLDIEAIGDKEEFTIEVDGNEELVDGENIITIIVKSKDGEQTATYKIIVNKEAKAIEAVTTPVLDVTPDTGEDDSVKIIKMAIVGFTTVVAIAGIIFAVIEYRYGKKKEDEEDDVSEAISFASVGFENEDNDKEDILEEFRDTKSTEMEENIKEFDFTENKKTEKELEENETEEDIKENVPEYRTEKEDEIEKIVTNYELSYTSKNDDVQESNTGRESRIKNRRLERTPRRSRGKRAKIKDEEFEDVEETFEVLNEEGTSLRKRGKHF